MLKKWYKRKLLYKIAGMFFIVIFMLQGCYKEYLINFQENFENDYKWEPSLAFPIGEADFGLVIPHGFDTLLLQIDPVTRTPYWNLLDSIPLRGSIEFDFEKVLGNRDSINFAVLRVNAYNGFPIEIVVQAYLEDDAGVIVDSLFQPKFVMLRGENQAGAGLTSRAVHTQYDVDFPPERLDVLLDAKKITFTGNIKTVPLFDKYTFKIQLGAKLEILPKSRF